MYKDDQVAEETEEIILKRLKNELGESEFAVHLSIVTNIVDTKKSISFYKIN